MQEVQPARVARLYLAEHADSLTLDLIYSIKGVNFGGWQEDKKGKHLKLIVTGEAAVPETFKKYHDVRGVLFELPWPQNPINPVTGEYELQAC
jgi:hypothetical protein